MSIRSDLESRFGMPFKSIMQQYADQGFSRLETASQLGVSRANIYALLARHGDPFAPHDVAKRYWQETGESFVEAATRLSKTHTLNAAAKAMGLLDSTALSQALKLRGVSLEFRSAIQRRRMGSREGTAADLARLHGLRPRTVHQRLSAGHSLEEALKPSGTLGTWENREAFGVKGSLRDLAERFAVVPLKTVRHRLKKSWPLEKALVTPMLSSRGQGTMREQIARACQ
ncbi:hypothetical protein [uncultured Pseudomonas sp.]|uniref:hypothetical protein n=1 Tax=uncultured Pseudomonas sp. TaxID=114707 RepID=UPI0025FA6137|nr:hypothetical protein [uncultured Pseudomonas sp.]